MGGPVGMLVCHAETLVIQSRLKRRRNDVSDADWHVYQIAVQQWEPLGPMTAALTRHIDTMGHQAHVLKQALAMLKEMGMWGAP